MPENQQLTLKRMEAMLRHCRRRIMMARLAVRLRAGLQAYLGCLLGIAAVFLVLRVLAWAFGTPAPGGVHLVAAIGLFGALLLGRALGQGISGRPVQMDKAAERLDLSQATHNRIATAIALLGSGDESPFARAAIREGCEHLERLQAEEPHIDIPPVSWHRAGLFLAAGVALLVAGLFLVPKPGPAGIPEGPEATAVSQEDSPPDSPAPEDADKPADRLVDRAEASPRDRLAIRPDDTAEDKRGKRPEPGSESRSEGAMGRHASGESRSSQTASNSRSAANGGGAKSEPGASGPGKPPKPRDTKRQTAGQPKADQDEEKKGGSIDARGSSGAGSMHTAQNEWSSKVKAKSDDSDDFPQEEEPDEAMDPDKQRLGVQPALKSRSSRVSRELSLFTGSETANQQNRGRGGPGGQKKSRGTATMLMGVPVPGFVRGRLLPGPTKSTQEEVEPSPREGEYATASGLPPARPEEDPQERFRAPAAIGTSARDYLIQYHTEHEDRRNEVAPGE